MKNIAGYLLIYNFILLSICWTSWYSERVTFLWITSKRYNIFDTLDFPFYVLAGLVFVYYGLELSKMQFTYFVATFIYLAFKWLNFDVGYIMFFVWNYIIIVGISLMVWIESKINYSRFKK